MTRIITEPEFRAAMRQMFLDRSNELVGIEAVTGPGRSGAIAAVYASHMLGKPFLPYGQHPPELASVLVVDTAIQSGKTMRKACRCYSEGEWAGPARGMAVYQEPPRVKFWYESTPGKWATMEDGGMG